MIKTVEVNRPNTMVGLNMVKERVLCQYISGANIGGMNLLEGDIIWHDEMEDGFFVSVIGRASGTDSQHDVVTAPVNIDMLRVIQVEPLLDGDSITLQIGKRR